jgi:hypothetical protein
MNVDVAAGRPGRVDRAGVVVDPLRDHTVVEDLAGGAGRDEPADPGAVVAAAESTVLHQDAEDVRLGF